MAKEERKVSLEDDDELDEFIEENDGFERTEVIAALLFLIVVLIVGLKLFNIHNNQEKLAKLYEMKGKVEAFHQMYFWTGDLKDETKAPPTNAGYNKQINEHIVNFLQKMIENEDEHFDFPAVSDISDAGEACDTILNWIEEQIKKIE